MIDEILDESKAAMESSLKALQHELTSMRTGRASTGLVNKLMVEYYGVPTALQELALVSVPEAQLITIRPYDASAIKAIERAILQSDLGLNPNNDGKIIRLQIPRLTEERRRDLTKGVHKRVEESRISIRNARRDGVDNLRSFEKEKAITEDDMHTGQKKLQKLTDDYIKKVDDISAAKEKEIMEV